jgi:hypothetical protein
MPVPNTFGTATAAIPLSQLDANFATPITIGNTAVQLGNTVTTLNNMTLANVTISSGEVTIGNVTVTGGTANGVAYLNGSKVLTTGSALVFNGTNLGIGASPNPSPGDPYRVLNIGTQGGGGIVSAGTDSYLTNNIYISGNSFFAYTGGSAYGSYYNQSGGNHIWKSSTAAGTGGNVATLNTLMTLNTNGALALFGGVSATGVGITFPATQSASTDANTLDDYEEGTWSSAVTNAANLTGTGSLDRAVYTKIGRLVTLVGRITGQTITTVTTGTAAGLTLPFAMIATDSIVMGPCRGSTSTEMIGIILDATGGDATSVNLNFPAAQVTANGAATFSFSLTYQASA